MGGIGKDIKRRCESRELGRERQEEESMKVRENITYGRREGWRVKGKRDRVRKRRGEFVCIALQFMRAT